MESLLATKARGIKPFERNLLKQRRGCVHGRLPRGWSQSHGPFRCGRRREEPAPPNKSASYASNAGPKAQYGSLAGKSANYNLPIGRLDGTRPKGRDADKGSTRQKPG